MRKTTITLIILLTILSLFGCTSSKDTLESKQQKAIKNSITYIKNSAFTAKDRIDTTKISISYANEKTWESVWVNDSKVDKSKIDFTDWVITIGNTSNGDFAILVCDSDTTKVIGYKPID